MRPFRRHATSRAKPDLVLLALIAGLVVFGMVMLASASGPLGLARFGDAYYFVKHQLLYGVVPGVIALLVMMRIPYRVWKRAALPLLVFSIVLLVLVFIPGIRAEFGTARSWIQLGPFSMQPSEVVKLTFLLYLAAWLEVRGEAGVRSFRTGLVPFLVVLGAVMGLLILQPDTGSMSIIVIESLVVYFIAGAALPHLIAIGGGGLALLALLIKISPYRAARLMTFLHPELDPQGVGYHINQALLAAGSGGLLGLGLGHSRQKFQYLPEVQGDSIFAVMAEELGFLFGAAFIALLLLLLWRGLRTVAEAPDQFGKLVGVGILTWITFQAFLNIGAMIGIMPLTGVPLPFVSYGGTALVTVLAASGVLLNISKHRR
ncbi:putative lipid II flippase FtsW [Candidatus Uhrbacteria bacterium]|nr:putative lipid II flippase FtsW [Candidatus Uhrbacteria bacterium]